MARVLKEKAVCCTKLANQYGGWLYCEGCGKTVAYLCYTTYDEFGFQYECHCGNHGMVHILFDEAHAGDPTQEQLITIKNRVCCPEDESPLFSVVKKQVCSYTYSVICHACHRSYLKE